VAHSAGTKWKTLKMLDEVFYVFSTDYWVLLLHHQCFIGAPVF